MNKDRRKRIQNACEILKDVLSEEEMYFDNMPENLQGSDRGMQSEDAIDILTGVVDSLEEIMY